MPTQTTPSITVADLRPGDLVTLTCYGTDYLVEVREPAPPAPVEGWPTWNIWAARYVCVEDDKVREVMKGGYFTDPKNIQRVKDASAARLRLKVPAQNEPKLSPEAQP